MRNFSMRFYKNLIWIYICAVIIFTHNLFMGEIPDHIYLSEGDEIQCKFSVPVSVTEEKRQETMIDVTGNQRMMESDYVVTCKLFGFIPVKEVEVSVVPERKVYASGRLIGIYGETSGVLVLGTSPIEAQNGLNYEPAENKVLSGDYIIAVNDEMIQTKEELVSLINTLGEDEMILSINRKGEYIDVAVKAVPTAENKYMLGIWVKDDIAGIGTMTYYTTDGYYGALGHGMGDGETGELLSMATGSIYKTRLLGITKGQKGEPGELEGLIYYGGSNCLGSIMYNDNFGIYGNLQEEDCIFYQQDDVLYKVGYKQDIQKDSAYILSDISGKIESYEIEIESLDFQKAKTNRGIHFCVTDETLLEKTGGIVQGMSGSPIVQNGRIVGAVTHVLVNDPTRGYGIFIENMLEH